jgi:predicted DNA-binding transcriptional regulator AlpA
MRRSPAVEAGSPEEAASLAPVSLVTLADRLALRLDEVARALGVSRRAIERERSAGRFPAPDLLIGRMPLWKPETIRQWVERGGR